MRITPVYLQRQRVCRGCWGLRGCGGGVGPHAGNGLPSALNLARCHTVSMRDIPTRPDPARHPSDLGNSPLLLFLLFVISDSSSILVHITNMVLGKTNLQIFVSNTCGTHGSTEDVGGL